MPPARPSPPAPPDPAFDSAGLLHVVASVEAPDLDDEVVVPSTLRLDEYRKNPVVLFGHAQDRLPVATCERVELVGDELHQWWRFGTTKEASDVARLYREKILRGASVGFKSDGVRRISAEEAYRRYGVRRPLKVHLGGELKETSAVPVPCNAAALAVGWEARPAALKVAAAGRLAGEPVSGLVCKALARYARQAHGRATIPPTRGGRRVSTTKAMDTMADTAGAAVMDPPAPPADAGGGHEDVISGNTLTAGQAIWADIVSGALDPAEGLKKLKTLLRAHGDLLPGTPDDAADAEPADEPDGDEGADLTTASADGDADDEDDLETKGDGEDGKDDDDAYKAAGGLSVKALSERTADALESLKADTDARLEALEARLLDLANLLCEREGVA